MEHRRALVEQHRVDALDPGGVLAAQVMVGLQQRPALQDLRRRDPALRAPARRQQVPHQPRVRPVGLGPPLAAALRRGVSGLGQVRGDTGRRQLPGHIPPAGACLDGKRDILRVLEPQASQDPEMLPVPAGAICPHCTAPVSRST